MFINKTGFNGYLKPRLEKLKKIKQQDVQTETAVEFEKDKNSKEKKNFSEEKKDSKQQEFQREDNELINITA